jgi:rfaE bifunctional protein nucleotidyltransferase chain/domain
MSPLIAPAQNSKIVDWDTLLARRAEWREEGKTVVWTNGCFDLLHRGHVRSLAAARRLGDVLVVGLNSDASVRCLKGPHKPILPQEDRAEVLAALECVRAVIVFDELTPEAALARLQPDIHCKGEDYAPPHGKPIPERAVVEAYGGRIEFLPLLADLSSSSIIRQIRQHEGAIL